MPRPDHQFPHNSRRSSPPLSTASLHLLHLLHNRRRHLPLPSSPARRRSDSSSFSQSFVVALSCIETLLSSLTLISLVLDCSFAELFLEDCFQLDSTLAFVVQPTKAMETGKRDLEENIDKEAVNSKKQKVDKSDVAEESSDEEPQAVKKPQDTRSKTLSMANLSPEIRQVDVTNFFNSVGKIVEVRFVIKRDGQFANYAYVEFATPEAAQEAHKLSNTQLHDRPVILHLAEEACAFPPLGRGGGNVQSYLEAHEKTVFVKGFGVDAGFDNVRLSLEKHFRQCGMLVEMMIPEFYKSDDGVKKGDAFIYFSSRDEVMKALELNGSDVGGCKITVEKAKPGSVENYDDSSSEKEDGDVEMTDTPSSPEATRSKTLFMGCLSSNIQEADIKMTNLMATGMLTLLPMRQLKRLMDIVLLQASKLNDELLLDIPVRLELVAKTGTFTSGRVGNEWSFQKDGEDTLFVSGFPGDNEKFDNLRLNLMKHFGDSSLISRIDFFNFYEGDGVKKVDCFIKFAESVAYNEALTLNGSDVEGCTITVTKAEPRVYGGSSGGPGTGKKTTSVDE
ncbi:unnamed protein product [Lactuca virosa]|uniref:RRM domain-containing protein n=1 Tax=Lactuca virosa TaxID=75947 RepID=A0AAU9LEJ9_9ASTR|nr:unnamed protein product [Lactuca virosa]